MADGTTICIACGSSMLVRTAKRYDGKCIPCAKGYREDLEKARLFNEELKRRGNEPDFLFWRSLCERVDNPALGFNSLPIAEKLFFAVCLLEGEVFNGGFEQYFTNSSSDYFDYAARGLERMGDEFGGELLTKAKRLLFDENSVPNHEERLEYFETTRILEDSGIPDVLDGLDAAFRKHSENELSERLTKFALDQGFWEAD